MAGSPGKPGRLLAGGEERMCRRLIEHHVRSDADLVEQKVIVCGYDHLPVSGNSIENLPELHASALVKIGKRLVEDERRDVA